MEPLFRLSLMRPPVQQDPVNPSIGLAQSSDFQTALAAASSSADPRTEVRAVARAFIASARFVGDPARTPLAAATAAFSTALDALAGPVRQDATGPGVPLRRSVLGAVREAYGGAPEAVAAGAEFKEALARLRDSLLAIKYLPDEHGKPIEALTHQLRHLEIVVQLTRTAEFPAFPATVEELRRARKRSVELPGPTGLEPALSTVEAARRQRAAEREKAAARQQRAGELLRGHGQLRSAMAELTGLTGDSFHVPVQEAFPGALPPAEPTAELLRQIEFHGKLETANLRALEARAGGGTPVAADPEPTPQSPSLVAGAAQLAGQLFGSKPDLLDGKLQFLRPVLGAVAFRLGETGAARVSAETRTLMTSRGIDLTGEPLDRIVAYLVDEVEALGAELDALYGQPARRSVKRVGDALVTVSTPLPSPWTALVVGEAEAPDRIPLGDPRIPATRGRVKPAGMADLLLVRQQLIGYEAADVAHIENVLRGESKQREHTRRQETEQITFRETEVTTSEERELESTDRFEMTKESSEVIKEDASLKAGLTVSGKYGPTVEFSASAEGSVSRSKEEATKSASTFSQDVTERSANRISERVLERTSLRVTTEVTEKNTHGLDNKNGIGHISGVYQWVNKVYEAQMYNYGLRTMFDFMIPEPAAFLIHSLQSAHASTVDLVKPPEFPLRPNRISEYNYPFWVRAYGATDVAPPPEPYRTKSFDFKGGGGDSKTNYNHSGQIAIDDGYQAVHASVGHVANIWSDAFTLDVVIGRRQHRFTNTNAWVWSTALDDERDSVPVALDTFRASQIAVAVEVKCRRTARAMDKWRLETHAKLTTAYRARLAEYEAKLAELQLQAGVAIRGRNPQANQQLITDELRKSCISVLTEQHFDLFDAIDAGAGGIPQIDVWEAAGEGAYVRFFEQAFEWEHLTWVAYPYFWGRKDRWDERLSYEDPDPVFNQFIKAGYCRVTVPARPGFEGAIDHYMNFGELWNGGPLPPISSPLYLPIADEIAERLDRPGEEVPQGEPWKVRIPTTLVHLRPDDTLPRWTKNPDGEWVER
ncbi:hypothetical protein ACFWBN_17535 [Streptomyces sp. NPDC059989]|uniref:hypothetical protein n=1 Tax=Streptomyces sp. NPDC059989 TaxID=3347026 RepID=UPI0036752B23